MSSKPPKKSARRHAEPPIALSTTDEEQLTSLAMAQISRNPEVATLLLYEIDRARIVSPGRLPPDVVAMHSHVEFRDEVTGAVRQVQLVYPHEADIEAGRISILTLVGSALIGMVAGNSILWPAQLGHKRMLTVLRVSSRPFDEPDRLPDRSE